jgi:Ca-activated chloride channel family protein
MNRTVLLVSAAGLLALAALALGLPTPGAAPHPASPVAPAPPAGPDTRHTVARPEDPPATLTLPLVTSTPAGGALTLTGKLSGAYVLEGPGEAFAWLELKARPMEAGRRVPVNLALVLDRSGSMAGQKLEDARRAAAELVSRLTPEDRLAFIDYGTDVRVQPSRPVTPAVRAELLKLVGELRDEGSTNISGGLTEAANALRPHLRDYRVSRAILLSDGQPTVGLVEDSQLFNLAATLREQGITVSALGVGEDFQEKLMRGMAERGGGFSGFIDDSAQLAEVFSRELDQATSAVARHVELYLTLAPHVQAVDILGVPSTREGNTVRVPLYDLAANQSVRVVAKLRLNAGATSGPLPLMDATVRYVDVARDVPAGTRLQLSAEVTRDAAVVQANLDKEVRVHAARALGAQQMQAAAEEMKRGNHQVARGLLGNARKLFGASASALSAELREVDQAEAAYNDGASSEEIRKQSRDLYKKSMKNFGQDNAY